MRTLCLGPHAFSYSISSKLLRSLSAISFLSTMLGVHTQHFARVGESVIEVFNSNFHIRFPIKRLPKASRLPQGRYPPSVLAKEE